MSARLLPRPTMPFSLAQALLAGLALLALPACGDKDDEDAGDTGSLDDPGDVEAGDGSLSVTVTGGIEGTLPEAIGAFQCVNGYATMSWTTSQTLDPDAPVHGMVLVSVSSGATPDTYTEIGGVADLGLSLEAPDGTDYTGDGTYSLVIDEVGATVSGSFEVSTWPLGADYIPDTSQPAAVASGTFSFPTEGCL